MLLTENSWTAQSSPQSRQEQGEGRKRRHRSGSYYAQFDQPLPFQPLGLMVKRKKTSPTIEEYENG